LPSLFLLRRPWTPPFKKHKTQDILQVEEKQDEDAINEFIDDKLKKFNVNVSELPLHLATALQAAHEEITK
jgi:hypothetical protein